MADQDWWGIQIVREHVRLAADAIAQAEAASFEEFMRHQLTYDPDAHPMWAIGLESPLEALFYIWWQVETRGYLGTVLRLETQQHVEMDGMRYRLDFVIGLESPQPERLAAAGLSWPLIAVEVDGHAFHEKTPEQVAYRNQRDRLLQQFGWVVLHYSWSEMTTRPEQCLREVLGVAWSKFEVLRGKAWAAEQPHQGE
jgi:uncharacterized protein DUF559